MFVVTKHGKIMMANARVARKFKNRTRAKNFVANLVRCSKTLKMGDFDLIAI
jgi:hypothetical protein